MRNSFELPHDAETSLSRMHKSYSVSCALHTIKKWCLDIKTVLFEYIAYIQFFNVF